MLGLLVTAIFVFVAVCFVGLLCVCCHLPICPLFCVGLGIHLAKGKNDEAERERLARAQNSQGYTIVDPLEEHYFEDDRQAALMNSANPQGTISNDVAQAYLVPPLQQHHQYAQVEATMVQSSSAFAYAHDPAAGATQHVAIHHDYKIYGNNDSGGDGDAANDTDINEIGFGDYGMFRDTIAAIVFLLNVLWVVSIAAKTVWSFHNLIPAEQTQYAETDVTGIKTVASAVIFLALFASVCNMTVFTVLLMKYSEELITATFWVSLISFAFLGTVSLLSGGLLGTLIFYICAAATYWWLKNAANRIAFASAILTTAISAVKQNLFGLISTSMFVLILQVSWIFFWAIAAIGTLYKMNPEDRHDPSSSPLSNDTNEDMYDSTSGTQRFTFVLMAFQLFWGMEVCKNVISSTVSGTIACWWFTPSRTRPVRGALFRSLTTSFGCICLGSLLVAVLHTVRFMCEMLRNNLHSRSRRDRGGGELWVACILCCIESLLRLAERLVQYFNRYAFCYNAAYGTNFLTSGRRVMDLFTKRGWTAIINDDLIRNVLTLLTFGVGMATALFAWVFSFSWADHLNDAGIDNAVEILTITGFVLGVGVGILMTNVVDSAVVSVFTFFAEDPSVFNTNHPQLYSDLTSKWLLFNPNTPFSPNGTMIGIRNVESPQNAFDPIAGSAPPIAEVEAV
jgi:hypothetical protein